MEDMKDKVLFENSFTPNIEDIHDYIAQLLPDKSLLSALICCIIVMVVGLLWWQLIALGLVVNQLLHLLPAIFLMVAIMVTDIKLKRMVLKRSVKKYIKKNKSVLEKSTVIFYEERLESAGESLDYSKITKILYGDSCMFLITGKDVPLIIKDADSAFITGNKEDFWPFLESKIDIKDENKKSAVSLFR